MATTTAAPVIPHRPGNSAAQDLAAYNKNAGIKTPGGALATDPKFSVSSDPAQQAKQLAKWQAALKAGDKNAKGNIAAIKAAMKQTAAGAGATPKFPTPLSPEEQQRQAQYDEMMTKASSGASNLLDQTGAKAPFDPATMGIQQFNPGDFQQQFQGAYGSAMNQFNRSSEPAFQKQKQDFDQFAAERGIDPTSDQYKQLYKARISDPQDTARLNAQDTAYQTGLSAQQQAYGQAAGTYGANVAAQGQQYNQQADIYKMPYENLGAYNPFIQAQYGAQQGLQNQGFAQMNAAQAQEYAKELEALKQKYSMQNLEFAAAHRGGGGGGGGGGSGMLSLQDQLTLQNNAATNNMVLASLAGGGSQNPGMFNSGLQGLGQGVGAAITAGLVRGS